jgi:hypothetical protein
VIELNERLVEIDSKNEQMVCIRLSASQRFAALLCLAFLLLSGCSSSNSDDNEAFSGDASGQFGSDKPYALMVAEARSIYHAQNIARRLSKMGVPTEIIATDDDASGGAWFRVLVAHSADTTALYAAQRTLSEKHQLHKLKEYHYPDVKPRIIKGSVAEFREKETQKVKSGGVHANPALDEVIRQYPYSPDYILKFAAVFHSPLTETQNKFFGISKTRIPNDLPRGIKRGALLKHTDAYCEVKLEDNIYGDEVTVNVIKLKEQPMVDSDYELASLQNDPVRYYAQKILDTGDYITEKMEPFKVEASESLEGLLVTIEPKPNYVRTYGILADPSKRYIYFSQSTKKSLDEIKKLLSFAGKSKGLTAYQEFHNAFSILPQSPHPMDMFTSFYMNRLTWSYAKEKSYRKWAKQSVGRWYSEAHHHTKGKGYWSYGSVDFISNGAAVENVKLVGRDGRTNVPTYGRTGYRLGEKRRNRNSYKSYNFPVEVSLASGRLKVWISNGGRSSGRQRWKWGWLDTDMLVDRIERLQLDQVGGYKTPGFKDTLETPDGGTDFTEILTGFDKSCNFNKEFRDFHAALMMPNGYVLKPPKSLRKSFGLVKTEKKGSKRRVSLKNAYFHGLALKEITGIEKGDGVNRIELVFDRPLKEMERQLIPKITLDKIREDSLGTGDPRDVYAFKKVNKRGILACAWN